MNDANSAKAKRELRVIRVKRKRSDQAPHDLVVEGLMAPVKRPHTSLSDALGGMGLQSEAAAAVRLLFRKAATLSAAQLSGMAVAQLQALLDSHPAAQQADMGEGHMEGTASSAAAASLVEERPTKRRATRYEQIRRRRGLTNFERTEAATDPLRELTGLYDVVCMSTGDENGTESEGLGPRAGPYQEGTLMCNYLPMVREHLRSTAVIGGGTTDADGIQDNLQMQDDYVYDLYVAAAAAAEGEGDGAAAEAGEEQARWWELHRAGMAPVMRLSDDAWLVAELSDVEDSDAESDDSNAEGFFANDYPDESSSEEGSEFDGSSDDDWGQHGSEASD